MAKKNKNIVLIHGWGSNVQKLKPLEAHLKKLGWKTLSLKLPGFDLASPKTPWKLADYVGFVRARVEKRFGRSYFIFGHSFGGRLVIKMASDGEKEPEGIILCSAAGISRGNGLKRFIFLIVAKIGKILYLIPPASKLAKRILYKLSREHDYEKTVGVMRQTFVNVINENLKDVSRSIKTPTLIIWGGKDQATPYKDAIYLNKVVKKSKLESFKQQGHDLPYKMPGKLAKAIETWYQTLS